MPPPCVTLMVQSVMLPLPAPPAPVNEISTSSRASGAVIAVFAVLGDHSTGVWVGGSDNGHVGRWAWFPTGECDIYGKKTSWEIRECDSLPGSATE